MKISTSLEHAIGIAGVSARESARMMKQAGFDGVDLSMCMYMTEPARLLTPEWREHIVAQAEALRAEGLGIAQCHLPFFPGHMTPPGDGSYQAFEDFMLPSYVRAMEVCGEVGCRVAVMHPFFLLGDNKVSFEGNVRMIEKLLPYMEKYDVKLALENIYGAGYAETYVSRAEGITAIIEACGERVGACIDTGHANIFGINIADMARTYGKRLYALHVNGNAGKDEHVIPYTMSSWCENMDFHAFSAALKDIGYAGHYNLEIAHGALPASCAQAYLSYAGAVARALADEAE